MISQASWDTSPELAVRSELRRRGLRFRVHERPVPALRREADVVFASLRVAAFVDGCFWHGCPRHRSQPRANAEWWREKIAANRRRDRQTTSLLRRAGWRIVRAWEHEPAARVARRIERVVKAACARGPRLP